MSNLQRLNFNNQVFYTSLISYTA
uniref:Uncharacterized protein n=1 Tax=Rhizophora mucronata TaxID=61149 RepID=A0A2P2IQZ6_RHIMU